MHKQMVVSELITRIHQNNFYPDGSEFETQVVRVVSRILKNNRPGTVSLSLSLSLSLSPKVLTMFDKSDQEESADLPFMHKETRRLSFSKNKLGQMIVAKIIIKTVSIKKICMLQIHVIYTFPDPNFNFDGSGS